jgi:chromosomal replication initiator protein
MCNQDRDHSAERQPDVRTFGLQVEQLTQRSRKRVVNVPRQIAIYLSKQVTDASLTEIGHQFGDMHYTTVTHSIARIHERKGTDRW